MNLFKIAFYDTVEAIFLINSDWAMWENVHGNPYQKKRANSALAKELTPLELDSEGACGVFAGSDGKSYITTLFECQCVDFYIRNGSGPCKHMYRLAMELSLYPSDGIHVDQKAALVKFQRGELQVFIKTEPLAVAIGFYRLLDSVFKSSKGVSLDTLTVDFPVNTCYLFDCADPTMIKRDKVYSKDVKSLTELLIHRIGKLCLDNLDKNLLSVLLNL